MPVPWPACRRAILTALAVVSVGCDAPHTTVVVENAYPPAPNAPVVYRARWLALSFVDPLPPGAASDPQATPAASANTAYAILAPGWDPATGQPPASMIVVRSQMGFEVHLEQTLHIPVGDATFAGNCAAGSMLAQEEADFITGRVFAGEFAGLAYDAATCTASVRE